MTPRDEPNRGGREARDASGKGSGKLGLAHQVEIDAPRLHFQKPIPLSERIALDRERCVLCYRCTRYYDEIAWEQELTTEQRGVHSYIASQFDQPALEKMMDVLRLAIFQEMRIALARALHVFQSFKQ